MNKFITLLASLASISAAHAEIALTDSLSMGGFVTMAHVDSNSGNSATGVDQVEFDFFFQKNKVEARVDIEFEDLRGRNDGVEQAFVKYNFNETSSLTVGRVETMLGHDSRDPGDRYFVQALTEIGAALSDLQYQGIRFDYGNFAIALNDFADSGVIFDSSGYGLELGYSLEIVEGLNGFMGLLHIDYGNAATEDLSLYNAHLSYRYLDILWIAEYFSFSDVFYGNYNSYSLMANYSYSNAGSISLCYADTQTSGIAGDMTTYAASHNYALSDQLSFITEVNNYDFAGDMGSLTGVTLELQFVF